MNMQVDAMTKCAKVKQQKTYVICYCDAMSTQSCCILRSRTPLLVEVILPICHTNFTTKDSTQNSMRQQEQFLFETLHKLWNNK